MTEMTEQFPIPHFSFLADSEAESGCFLKAQHQIHVLHRRAAGALAQVVEQGGDGKTLIIACCHDHQIVRSGPGIGIDGANGASFARLVCENQPLTGVVVPQCLPQLSQ